METHLIVGWEALMETQQKTCAKYESEDKYFQLNEYVNVEACL